MASEQHPVITNDYPENSKGGVMVCGINFGISKDELAILDSGVNLIRETPSFFSDEGVRKSDEFKNRIVKWLNSWGIQLAYKSGMETSFERSFFQTNWLISQTENAKDEGKIDNLIRNSTGLLSLIEERQPAVILFFGKNLIEAFNDTRSIESLRGRSVREAVVSILGERSGNAVRHEAYDKNGGKIKFHINHQKFGQTQIICFPHPTGSHGVRDEDIALLKPPIHVISRILEKIPTNF